MGKAFIPFFGDKTKEELEKELKKVSAEIENKQAQKAELEAALAEYERNNAG